VEGCGETRMAVVLVDLAVKQQSTITAPTLQATDGHLDQLLTLLDRYAGRAWGLICAGSLPLGLPVDSYARLLRHARRQGMIALLDTSGEALREGVAGLPHILKVNHREIASLGQEMPHAPNAIAELAESLLPRLNEWASDALIVTLGERGALAVTSEGSTYVRALNGGVMLARSRGDDWPAALALGTAAAASVVMNEGTAICQRKQVEELLPQVQIARWSSRGR
jgi:fructose-1-phosphate kinase PfkB-like protein